MTRSEVLARARQAIGHQCAYSLGKGGYDPSKPLPWGSAVACDCSGFAAWCLGISRKVSDPAYVQQNGGWFETTAMVHDAKHGQALLEAMPDELAKPGDLIAYGDSGGKQGHVGVVSQVDAKGPTRAIHCSVGNWKRTGDAVQETGTLVWMRPEAVVCRPKFIQEDNAA